MQEGGQTKGVGEEKDNRKKSLQKLNPKGATRAGGRIMALLRAKGGFGFF